MSDASDTSGPASTAVPVEVVPAVPLARQPASGAWKWALIAAMVLGGTALLAARLHDVQHELQRLQQRTDELGAQRLQDAARLRDFEDRIEATARRTEQLEQQLTLLAGRDPSADAELHRMREQSALAETDELLTLALSQLQISHDPAAAASALATADARLARLARAQFFALREALARDIERLRKAPAVDLTGMAIRLDRLVQGVDSWHLLADPNRRLAVAPAASAARQKPDAAPAGRLNWISREFGDAFRDLVRIRAVDAPESLLMPADQHQLVREHLRVRLLNARQAMLMRNESLFRADLADSQNLLGRYFDGGDPLVAAALAQLKSMAATAVDAPLPSLDDSQAALRAARPSLP